MKCLIFIFTFCSIGTFIDMQGETDTEPAQSDSDNLPLELRPEDNQTEEEEAEEDDAVADDDPAAENESNNASETSNSEEDEPSGHLEPKQVIVMDGNSGDKKDKSKQIDKETMRLFMNELAAGDTADLIGQNQHIQQSSVYHDLGRRSEPQTLKNNVAENPDYLTPEKAPPELVLLVAKESRLLRAGKNNDLNDFDRDKILRSGDYWDGVWKEEFIPKSAIRSAPQAKQLGSIKAKINPGTEFYNVVSRMKKMSTKLLYIINKK